MPTVNFKIIDLTLDNIVKVQESLSDVTGIRLKKQQDKIKNGVTYIYDKRNVSREFNNRVVNNEITISAEEYISLYHKTPIRIKLNIDTLDNKITKSWPFLKHPDLVLSTQTDAVVIDQNGLLTLSFYYYGSIKRKVIPKNCYTIIKEEDFQKMRKEILFTHYYGNGIQIYNLDWLFTNKQLDLTMNYVNNLKYYDDLRINSKGKYWKHLKPQTKYFKTNYLNEQLRTRYGFFNRPISGLSNVIFDSFFPRLLYKYNGNRKLLLDVEKFPSTAVAISPFIAEYLNIKKIPVEQLCRVLGYTKKDIIKLLKTVKAKKQNIVFVGAGGTGINTAYWLTELVEMTNVVNLFNKIGLFEKETIEFSNILRFPLSLAAYGNSASDAKKQQLILPLLKKLTRAKVFTGNTYLTSRTYAYKTNGLIKYNYGRKNGEAISLTDGNTILYGAPEIRYREDLAKVGPLVCATHADTTCSIWLNPKQDENIQVETYGLIQLGSFFMNQLKMAISLLELIASDQDFTEQDRCIMNFEFDGTIQLKTDRQYHWQIDKNLLVMTDEEANAIGV